MPLSRQKLLWPYFWSVSDRCCCSSNDSHGNYKPNVCLKRPVEAEDTVRGWSAMEALIFPPRITSSFGWFCNHIESMTCMSRSGTHLLDRLYEVWACYLIIMVYDMHYNQIRIFRMWTNQIINHFPWRDNFFMIASCIKGNNINPMFNYSDQWSAYNLKLFDWP